MAGRHRHPCRPCGAEHVDPRRGAAHRRDHLLPRVLPATAGAARRPPAGVQPVPVPGALDALVSSELLETARLVGTAWRRRSARWSSPPAARTLTTAETHAARRRPRRADALLEFLRALQPRAPRARHGRAGPRGRHRGQRGDVRRDRGERPAAVRARALRARDRARRTGAEASLRGFALALERVARRGRRRLRRAACWHGDAVQSRARWRRAAAVARRRGRRFPPAAHPMLALGHARVLEYQDDALRGALRERLGVCSRPSARPIRVAAGIRDHARDRALAGAVDGVRRHRARGDLKCRASAGRACAAR